MNLKLIFILGGSFALSLLGSQAASVDRSKLPPASDKQGVTYATDIKPIFDASCVRCHSGNKPKGQLHLDNLAGVLAGSRGGKGKVIHSGDSANSPLVLDVANLGDPNTFMPPPRNKEGIASLTKDQVGLIRAWIDQGAK